MNEAEFMWAIMLAFNAFVAGVPKRSGNMAYNATRLVQKSKWVFEIRVVEAVAPYLSPTNEPWISPRWNGKKNPNEGWFEDKTDVVVTVLAQQLGGTVTKN